MAETMTRERELFEAVGAIILDNHFVYTSGLHGPNYINKDGVYPHIHALDELCYAIAKRFADDVVGAGNEIEAAVAPAIGAVDLKTGVARILNNWTRGKREVIGVYAEREEQAVADKSKNSVTVMINKGDGQGLVSLEIPAGGELVIRKPTFVIKRGYDKLIAGKRVLVVEDILTTGGSARETVEAARRAGATVVAVAALANRGQVTAEALGVPRLEALVNVEFETFPAAECPLCQAGVPVNQQLGHGRKFLAEQKAAGE